MLMLQLLGSPQIRLNEKGVDVHSAKARALLFYLATNPRAHTRAALADLLWPEMVEANARTNLRQAVYHLHQAIPNCLTTTRDSLKCNEQLTPVVDALRFQELATQGLKLSPTVDAQALLRSAGALYQGEFLADFYVGDATPYEEWMVAQREHLLRLAFQVLQRLTAQSLATQQIYEGLHYAQRLLALEPWHEESHYQLMQLLALNGQTQAALAQYETCCRLLREELGMSPSHVLVKLADEIQRGVGIARPASSAQPTAALQPTIPTTAAQPAPLPRHNLPTPLSSFVGRSRDLTALEQMLTTPEIRLVSLVGPGGVGKTRLANQMGRRLLPNFPDGVWLIDLLAVNEEALMTQAVTTALDIHEHARCTPLASLQRFLADKQLLLLFDNCEHIIDAAAQLTATLLQAAPQLKIVATSREPLHIAGERCVSVFPLALPHLQQHDTIQQLIACESVQLFVERASAHICSFALNDENAQAVARICQLLDGIPLAIELVAARARVLSVQQMAAQLESRPDAHLQLARLTQRGAHPRHQTLLNLIAWSYRLLLPAERLLLARLAVFHSGWSLAAAEAICGDEVSTNPDPPITPGEGATCHLAQDAILDLLTALIDKSLVVTEPRGEGMRYRLLETIRQFALTELTATGEESRLRDRHLFYFADLMEAHKAQPPRMAREAWQTQIVPDLDNVRAALTWSLRRNAATLGLRLALAVSDFWFRVGFHREGVYWIQLLLALPAAVQEKKLRLEALSTIAFTQWWALDNYAEARAVQQEVLRLAQEWGDQDRIEKTLNNLGGVALRVGDYGEANRYLEQSLTLTAQSGNQLNRAWSLILLGEVRLLQQQRYEAAAYFDQAGILLRLNQRRNLLAYPVRRLGQLALLTGDIPTALAHYAESLQINLTTGDVIGKAACVAAYAGALLHLDEVDQATQFCAAVSAALAASHAQMATYDAQAYADLITVLRKRMGESAFQAAWTTSSDLSLEQTVDLIQQRQAQMKTSIVRRQPILRR